MYLLLTILFTIKLCAHTDIFKTFNFHSLNKINGFVTTQYVASIIYIYLTPQSSPNDNGIDKTQSS